VTGPARTVPLLFLGTAHASLAAACLMTAWWPQSAAGFFYHPWMVAIVHLVTLGWITFSIVAALYIGSALALGSDLHVGRVDYVVYALAVIGLAGMVGHFWIQEYGGMAWSAGTIAAGVVILTARVAKQAWRGGMPAAVRLHAVLACVNFWIAASMGLLLAIDKVAHVLPGFVLSNVFAHAHVAAAGWASMMVAGVGYPLLTATRQERKPDDRPQYASAVLMEAGVLGLAAALALGSHWALVAGAAFAAGAAIFAGHVFRLVRRPAPGPRREARVDFAALHAASAGVSLAVATAIGLTLLAVPPSPRALHAAAAYGVLGLVGFLSQMMVAVEARLVPLAAAGWSPARRSDDSLASPPAGGNNRALHALVFAVWTVAVPLLAAGLYLESASAVGLAAWLLLAAVVCSTVAHVRTLRRAG
jgi:hypothetical protein